MLRFPARLLPFVIALFAAIPLAAEPRKLPETIPWDLVKLYEPPKFEWVESSGPVRSLFYAGESYQGHATRVFAYYATPGSLQENAALDKSLPAVVLVHGGGGTAFREWVELWAKRGYAAIAMDLAGYRPVEGQNPHQRENRTRLADGGPDQSDQEKFGNIDQPLTEQWSYHAIASVLRAHSLVRSFPEVDAKKTAVTGISWGGYLTCIAAGVDNRFHAAVPVYGCGFLHENSAWLDRFSKMSAEQKDRWVTLWDPSRYLPSVSMPILFVNGTNDFAYPLDSYMKSYDAVPGAKQVRITVNMPHGHPPGWAPLEIGLFVDQHLRDGTPLPTIDKEQAENGKVTARIQSTQPLSKTELHFTADTGPINQRKWTTQPGILGEGSITAAAPPSGATAWILTVTDDRGAVISGRVMLVGKGS